MFNNNYSTTEIEEEEDTIINHHQYLDTIDNEIEEEQEDSIYVAVGKSDTSMEALSWTLNNLTTHSTMLYLIHVFPEIKHIPHPLGVGMIARNQVSAEQVEIYMEQERNKRRQLLHKFIQSCSLSKVKVDTILIESDFVAKAILDLIPILQISNLVIGANKFHQRKARSKKGNGVADQVVQNAPENCKVRIICEGKEVNDEQMMMKTPSPKMIATANSANNVNNTKENDSVLCVCFKPKFK
ncbi:U-box domain-containing protein 54-like isoform X1 [Vicia villosa]|uniref:U-box domain-containing protein 54-like isoform X1 n=1 Tax=Vicia villosa TaxID=3911 RepID=UPI00273CC3CF|nr:U-box domain-containing protein 54-like isoform X1 [Vicia villosa]